VILILKFNVCVILSLINFNVCDRVFVYMKLWSVTAKFTFVNIIFRFFFVNTFAVLFLFFVILIFVQVTLPCDS